MKASLDHLPEHKQEELREVIKVISENTSKKTGMILLFGSYARGDWVEDRYLGEDGIIYEYQSDFDLLVITSTVEASQKHAKWRRIEEKLQNYPTIRTWTSLLVIDIRTLNNELKKGRYFYRDIQQEGIVLYDTQMFELAESVELSPEERKEEAQTHFQRWFNSANSFLIDFNHAYERNDLFKAAFELHQATERFFMTTLLVFTNYKPKLHHLGKLNRLVINQHHSFITIFPQSIEEDRQNFVLLQRAYIDSRYNMENYRITKEQLEWLAQQVEKLKELTQKNCQEKIESFLPK